MSSFETKGPSTIQPSARKLAAQRQLSQLALKVSDGSDYLFLGFRPTEVTLAQAREALQSIREPLAQVVIEERQ
jgi:hypothetical protein